MERIFEVDAFRGVAIIMMVVYHLLFDLDYFSILRIDLGDPVIVLFQRAIAVLFLALAGIGLTLSESRNTEGYAHHLKRGAVLASVAALITVATWIYPNDGYIQFGIIHLIAASTILAPLFFRFGKWNLVLGILIIICGIWFGQMSMNTHYLFWLGITDPGYHALDHYPLLPWFGVILIGMVVGWTLYPNGVPNLKINILVKSDPAKIGIVKALAFLGRNSLAVYLIHQPLIIAALMLFAIC